VYLQKQRAHQNGFPLTANGRRKPARGKRLAFFTAELALWASFSNRNVVLTPPHMGALAREKRMDENRTTYSRSDNHPSMGYQRGFVSLR
jgi:hypothetical protein